MRKLGTYVIAVLIATMMAACANSDYAPRYSDNLVIEEIEGDRYLVKVWGHPDRPRRDAQFEALFEAGNLAQREGFKHFRVIRGRTASREVQILPGEPKQPVATFAELEVELGNPDQATLAADEAAAKAANKSVQWINAKSTKVFDSFLFK